MNYHQTITDQIAKYGSCLQTDSESLHRFFLDVLEVHEDFQRLAPLFARMSDLSMPKEDFYQSILTLNAWCWHTKDHLNEIAEFLEKTEFRSGEESGQ